MEPMIIISVSYLIDLGAELLELVGARLLEKGVLTTGNMVVKSLYVVVKSF